MDKDFLKLFSSKKARKNLLMKDLLALRIDDYTCLKKRRISNKSILLLNF
jgi:hypothetical protein